MVSSYYSTIIDQVRAIASREQLVILKAICNYKKNTVNISIDGIVAL